MEVGYCTYSIVSDTNRMKSYESDSLSNSLFPFSLRVILSHFRIRRITHEIRTNLFENLGFAGERELKFLNRTQGIKGDSASSSYVTIRFLDKSTIRFSTARINFGTFSSSISLIKSITCTISSIFLAH